MNSSLVYDVLLSMEVNMQYTELVFEFVGRTLSPPRVQWPSFQPTDLQSELGEKAGYDSSKLVFKGIFVGYLYDLSQFTSSIQRQVCMFLLFQAINMRLRSLHCVLNQRGHKLSCFQNKNSSSHSLSK